MLECGVAVFGKLGALYPEFVSFLLWRFVWCMCLLACLFCFVCLFVASNDVLFSIDNLKHLTHHTPHQLHAKALRRTLLFFSLMSQA